MRNSLRKLTLLSALVAAVLPLWAQAPGSGTFGFSAVILAIVIVVLLTVVFLTADNLLRVEASRLGVKSNNNVGIFPNLQDFFRPKVPDYADNQEVTILRRGYDIPLEGEAPLVVEEANITTFALKPTDFVGMSPIPKVVVEVGDSVKAGDVIFFDKKRPEIKYCAPVSGEIVEVRRGAKRSITHVVIMADKEQQYRDYGSPDLGSMSREDLMAFLADSGVLPMIQQRPFQIVPSVDSVPDDIFVSTFDSAPLAPDANFVVQGREAAFQRGLEVLARLTDGKVHLGLDARHDEAPASVFTEATGVEKRWFRGPHPSGNVGIQIHHIDPINAGDVVWTAGVQEVCSIGALFTDNRFDARRRIALTGAELAKTCYVDTYLGAHVKPLVDGNLKEHHVRVVDGDVLSGKQVVPDDYMSFHGDQITVLLEGDYYEPFGWLLPLSPRPTTSGTIPTALLPKLKYRANTNTHGERRAYVVSGRYEKVLPMDMYPQQLMKAILVKDFERMEGLGLYELAPEDVALCEFVCTSKMPVQKITREGLDILREQG